MRLLDPRLLLGIGGAIATALVLVLVVLAAPSASPQSGATPLPQPCGSEPTPTGPLEIAANTSLGIWAVYGGSGRMSTWASASQTFDLYLLNSKEFATFNATGSGFNGTVHPGRPHAYEWTSGATNDTNSSFSLSGGSWYLVAYAPGTVPVYLYVAELACGPG